MPIRDDNEQLLLRVRSRFGKAMQDYGLVADGDRVLVGLSGGKDSLALVELLGERSRVFKPRFSVVAAHISVDNVPYQADTGYLKAFCESHHTEFRHYTVHFEPDREEGRTPCYLCARARRKRLFDAARELGCGKLALGHHQDDIATTLLMNLTFQGSFATMPPYLATSKLDVDIIRPLCLCRERDLRGLARLRGYRRQDKNCPYETQSRRAGMREVLERLEEMNPEAIETMWGAMTHIQPEYLPKAVNGKAAAREGL